jgi:ABC-type branched-subunit amino acid transport system substrate-binding protein
MGDNPFAISVVGTVPVSATAQVATSAGSKVPLLVTADGHLVDKLASTPGAPPIYGIVPDYTLEGQFDANFVLKTLNDSSPAIAYENDSLAQGADQAMTSYIPAHGGKVSANVALTTTTTNMVPIATQLQASGAKTVIAWMSSNLTATLQKAAAQIGYAPKWVSPFFALNSGYLKLAGSNAEGTYIDGIFPPTNSTDPAVQTFMTQVQSFAPTAATGSGEQGWEMASVLVAAIQKATANGTALTQANFVQALTQLNGTIGLTNINFTNGHHWGIDQVGWYQVKGGQFVQTQPPSPLPS